MSTEVMTRSSVSVFKADSLASAWDISQGLAKSDLIPPAFKMKPHNVMIALMVSQDIGVNPFTVMQNMSVISGKPCFSTAFLIAQANRHGVFSTPIDWNITGKGKDLNVEAHAVLARNGMRVSYPVSMAMAEAEGWTKNAKYRTMPELMLRYRSAATLINLYCPEVKSGVPSDVEAEADTMVDVSGGATTTTTPETPIGEPQKRGPGRPRGSYNKQLPAFSGPTEPPLAQVNQPRIDQIQAQLADLERQAYEWDASDDEQKSQRIEAIRLDQSALKAELESLT